MDQRKRIAELEKDAFALSDVQCTFFQGQKTVLYLQVYS